MTTETMKKTLRRELPGMLRDDPALRDYILEIARHEYPSRAETDDRFYQILGEMRRDREEQSRKWEEQSRKWEEQSHKWEEQSHKWEEQKRESRAYQEESNKRFDEVHREIMAQARKFDRTIGALGSRWGLRSEKAFRDALAGILEESFGIRVLNVTEFDEQGEVFGRPDQVELDVIIKNGLLILCELKSSMSKADMHIFGRKARFYERRHQQKANRLIVISPMIDAWARQVGEALGIEMYGDSLDVKVSE